MSSGYVLWGGSFLAIRDMVATPPFFPRPFVSSLPKCALRVISFAYLVTGASILAFTFYTWLIHHEAATRVAGYAYVNPLIARRLDEKLARKRL